MSGFQTGASGALELLTSPDGVAPHGTHLTLAASAALLAEEAAHREQQVEFDLEQARLEDQQRAQDRLQRFGSHRTETIVAQQQTTTAERGARLPNLVSHSDRMLLTDGIVPDAEDRRIDQSAKEVRWHVGHDDEGIEMSSPPQPGAATNGTAPRGLHQNRQSSARTIRRRESSTIVDVNRIKDADIRKYLDPSQPHVPASELARWSDEKLAALLAAVRSENFPRILEQAEKDGIQERAEPLTFSRINFTDEHGQTRLQDVSGYLVPGEVVGIIAAPDAGASTLLDLLAGEQMRGKIEGELRYNNALPDSHYKQTVGYISQNDLHLPLLTVEETLFFSARLRLPAKISDRMIRFRVQTVMKLLQLSHVASSFVGDDFVKGISGGQKRRLSVGVELVAGHSILLGDLVTNGLDSATAFDLIRTFRQMTQASLSIACTVVQAGPELFQLFHRCIIMSKGSIIYSGPPSLAEAYFRSIGFRRPKQKSVPQFLEEMSAEPEAFYRPNIARGLGPAATLNGAQQRNAPPRQYSSEMGVDLASKFRADSKWLDAARTKKFYAEPAFSLHIDKPQAGGAASGSTGEEKKLNKARVAAWQSMNQSYQSSIWYVDVRETINDLNEVNTDAASPVRSPKSPLSPGAPSKATTSNLIDNSTNNSFFGPPYPSTFWVQLRESFLRQGRNFYRARSTWLYIWVQALIMTFMLGSIFWQDELDSSASGVRNRQGLYFYLVAYCTFNSFSLLPIVLSQRPLVYAQTAKEFFSPLTYFLSLLAVQMIVLVVELLIFLIPLWGLSDLAGFPLSGAFWFAFLVLVTATLTARFFILFLCYLMPGHIAATTTLTVCFYVFALLAGEFIPKHLSPPGWSWAYNLSFMYWDLQALVMQDPVDAQITANLSGWIVGDDFYYKWRAWARGLAFCLAFGLAAAVTVCNVSWARAALPSPADFVSPSLATHKDEDMADEENEQVAVVGEAIKPDPVDGVPREANLEFRHLNYFVTLSNGQEKQLLCDVFGYAKPGRLVALMGQSGAGKSTLLDVLAGKKTTGRIEGEILVNGVPKDSAQFSKYAAYVEQFDSFNAMNTVRETVMFSGRLRLPPDLTTEELNRKVDRVLDILNLRPSEHSIVGYPGFGGISMELRKKLSIAVEVIAEPVLLFLDEPTTGLDSSSAANVMRTIRSLASSITVVCTIHQPPSELVANFQDVLLLEQGGQVVYFGDIESLPKFLHYAGLPEITPGRNVSDYALEVIAERAAQAHGKSGHADGDENASNNEGHASKHAEGEETAAAARQLEGGQSLRPLSAIYLESEFASEMKKTIEKGLLTPEEVKKLSGVLTADHKQAGFVTQTRELTIRFWQTGVRNRDSLFVRYLFSLIFGFIVGTIFCRTGFTQTEGPKKLSIIFFTVGHFLFSASSFFPEVFMNRVLYFREHSAKMYGPLSYFVARFLGDLPHILAEVFLTTLLVYFVSGLSNEDHSARYGYFFWACLILRCCAIFMTQLVASVIAAPDFAFSVLATIMYLMFALTGFFIPENQIGWWWRWLSYLNFLKYGLQFLAITEYRDEQFTCDPLDKDASTMVELTPTEAANYPTCRSFETFPSLTTPGNVLKCQYGCGFDVLESFGVRQTIAWQVESFVILHCFMIFFALAGFLALKYINHIKR